MPRPPLRDTITHITIAGALLLSGCRAPVSFRQIDAIRSHRDSHISALNSQELSRVSRQTLRLMHLSEDPLKKSPETLVEQLDHAAVEGNRLALFSIAEIAILNARNVEPVDSERTIQWYLLAASSAHDYLFQGPASATERAFDAHYHLAREIYNRSVARLAMLLHRKDPAFESPPTISVWGKTFHVAVEHNDDLWPPVFFDRLTPAIDFAIQGLKNRYIRHGLGGALIAVRENRQLTPAEQFFPPEGLVYPVTAVLRFSDFADQTRSASFSFYNPHRTRFISMGTPATIRAQRGRYITTDEEDRTSDDVASALRAEKTNMPPPFADNHWHIPLEADWTAPYAFLLSRTDFLSYRVGGILDVAKTQERLGIYLLEPFDPDKTPLLMVHGLLSSPLIWIELTNDIMSDETLRENYQIWHYIYPTGLPFLYSGMLFRGAIDALRQTLNPFADHPIFKPMVIVAHSMGGLLTKTLVANSEMELWNATFTVRPEELSCSEQDRNRLKEIFIFERKPYVDRVVFIATPHRGSDMARDAIGRIGSGLTGLPQSFVSLFHRITRDNPNAVTDSMEKILAQGGPSSIRALSSRHPLIKRMAQLPVHKEVPYHSIIGDTGNENNRTGTDGVVAYESSHLEDAESELIVSGVGHKVYAHPLAIAEIKRILKGHLKTEAREPRMDTDIR